MRASAAMTAGSAALNLNECDDGEQSPRGTADKLVTIR
jgi:hypothetical protein